MKTQQVMQQSFTRTNIQVADIKRQHGEMKISFRVIRNFHPIIVAVVALDIKADKVVFTIQFFTHRFRKETHTVVAGFQPKKIDMNILG